MRPFSIHAPTAVDAVKAIGAAHTRLSAVVRIFSI